MKKIGIYFRDEKENWEMLNLSFDPMTFNPDMRRKLIEVGCHYDLFGNSVISKNIDYFLSSNLVKQYSFDATGAGRYYYIMRREEV